MPRVRVIVCAQVNAVGTVEPMLDSDAQDILRRRIREVLSRADARGELDDPEGGSIIFDRSVYTDYELED